MAQPGVVPPVAPQLSPLIRQCSGAPPAFPQVAIPQTAALDAIVEYDSDEDFCWAGDEEGLGYWGVCPSTKSNASVAHYSSSPLCNHVQVEMILPQPSVGVPRSVALASLCICLPKALHHHLGQLSQPLIVCTQSSSLVVADTGATDHMTPDKSVFISYKVVANLQIRMGNNSFVPVLGRGTAIFSLNGQRVLVQNVLHVPGLAVPLYSLRTHLKQTGCGFFGTFEAGMLVYFPTFVLLVDTSKNCPSHMYLLVTVLHCLHFTMFNLSVHQLCILLKFPHLPARPHLLQLRSLLKTMLSLLFTFSLLFYRTVCQAFSQMLLQPSHNLGGCHWIFHLWPTNSRL
jgi:hypothetical protein